MACSILHIAPSPSPENGRLMPCCTNNASAVFANQGQDHGSVGFKITYGSSFVCAQQAL